MVLNVSRFLATLKLWSLSACAITGMAATRKRKKTSRLIFCLFVVRFYMNNVTKVTLYPHIMGMHPSFLLYFRSTCNFFVKKFGSFNKTPYLCNRNSEMMRHTLLQ